MKVTLKNNKMITFLNCGVKEEETYFKHVWIFLLGFWKMVTISISQPVIIENDKIILKVTKITFNKKIV